VTRERKVFYLVLSSAADVVTSKGPGSPLEASAVDGLVTRIGIDATTEGRGRARHGRISTEQAGG